MLFFYVVRQIVKHRNHKNIDIPDFLVGGDYPVNRGSGGNNTDPDPPPQHLQNRREEVTPDQYCCKTH